MQRYSLLNLARNALGGNRAWRPAWRTSDPKKAYDVIVIGGDGHGLATAYYLAKQRFPRTEKTSHLATDDFGTGG